MNKRSAAGFLNNITPQMQQQLNSMNNPQQIALLQQVQQQQLQQTLPTSGLTKMISHLKYVFQQLCNFRLYKGVFPRRAYHLMVQLFHQHHLTILQTVLFLLMKRFRIIYALFKHLEWYFFFWKSFPGNLEENKFI